MAFTVSAVYRKVPGLLISIRKVLRNFMQGHCNYCLGKKKKKKSPHNKTIALDFFQIGKKT